ncbi:hypothetical protein AMQ84_03910 [Paenibacillus riograndensis]|uniref:Sensor histidine kinase NatK-like C-terminal domain-containing protein n=1 Tax=Paenibacillus riograndensis TaxID=483937 RepID=A0A132UAG9_9BACL|nr:sensor histidine kinase [Paenibacillus riograndensis]KWX80396.1 hypothetical protein AMQ84_03910 [Paenibacillus riograndensis]
MNTLLREELLYLITFPLIPLTFHYFFSRCFACRIERRSRLVLLYLLYTACHIGLHHSPLPDIVLILLNTGLIILLSLLYAGDLRWKGYSALFMAALLFLSDTVLPFAFTDIGYLANLILSKLLMLLLVFLVLRIATGDGNGMLAGWYWCLLFLVPLLSIATLLQLSNNLFFRSYPQLFPVVPSLLLAINLLIYVLSDRILHAQAERSRRLLLEQQNTYYLNQYHLIRGMQEDSFKFQHDFKHILLGLRVKLGSGEAAATAQELDTLLCRVESPTGNCNTGNLVIDSMINYKMQEAARYGITFTLELNIPPQLALDTTALCVILGNALDNAIEACQGITGPAPERQISIHMHYLNESLFMRIRNPYVQPIQTNPSGGIRSAKPDHRAHGIGLKNIQKTIEEQNGLLDISYDHSFFQIEWVLFGIERQPCPG